MDFIIGNVISHAGVLFGICVLKIFFNYSAPTCVLGVGLVFNSYVWLIHFFGIGKIIHLVCVSWVGWEFSVYPVGWSAGTSFELLAAQRIPRPNRPRPASFIILTIVLDFMGLAVVLSSLLGLARIGQLDAWG